MHKMNIKSNLKILPIFSFINNFNFFYMILVLYAAELTGSYTLAMAVLSVYSIFVSILEIPTGMISDRIGRKKTITLGTGIKLISFTCSAMANYHRNYTLELLMLGSFFQAFAFSLYSGTDQALIYETMKQLKSKKHFASFSGKIRSMKQLALALSALFSGYLAHKYSYVFVIWITLIPTIMALITSLFIIEPSLSDKINEDVKNLNTALNEFKMNKKLQLISYSKIVTESFGISIHRVETLYFEMLVSLPIIGFVRFLKQFCGSISFWYSGKIISKFGDKNSLIFSRGFISVARLSALALNNPITPFLSSITNLFWGVNQTSFNELEQREFSSSQRATMGSIVSFFANILGAIVTIIIGYIADISSPRTAIFVATIPTILVMIVYGKIFKQSSTKVRAAE